MAVTPNGQLRADMDSQSTDYTGMQRDRMRKQGISQPGIIGLTLDELKNGRNIVTVNNSAGEPRAVHQDTYAGIKRDLDDAHQQAIRQAYEQGVNDYHDLIMEHQAANVG